MDTKQTTTETLEEDIKTPEEQPAQAEMTEAAEVVTDAAAAPEAEETETPKTEEAAPQAAEAADAPKEAAPVKRARRPRSSKPAPKAAAKPAPKKTAKAVPETNPDLPAPLPSAEGVTDLDDPVLYINREISWIEFNRKVLDEACSESLPLLEQLKFLSIFFNNLDEFFMVRVANICRQLKIGAASTSIDKLSPEKQLAEIRLRVISMLTRVYNHWRQTLLPGLAKRGVRLVRYKDLSEQQRAFLEGYFRNEIYPILTPQAIDPGHPFPTISNTSLNFLVKLEKGDGEARFARLKCPNNMPRFIFVPRAKPSTYSELGFNSGGRDDDIILLEDLIRENLAPLFPGHHVVDSALFRLTRNTDLEIEEDEADDLLEAVRDFVDLRRFGNVVRLEIEHGSAADLSKFLIDKLELRPWQVYRVKGPMAMSEFMPLYGLDRPSLKEAPYKGHEPDFVQDGSVFTTVRAHDVLLYHPYESFTGVLDFIRRASLDPQVVAMKQTLYRCGNNSPIVASLIDARRRGKQVTAVVELKARFDEERNINWAEEMEKAGVNVVYGFVGLKIHAKLCLVVRREADGMQRYAHIATGNYNPSSAKIYTDYGLLTSNKEICSDVSDLFNVMTGYSTHQNYRRLVVSPHSTRKAIIEHIDREIECKKATGEGEIILKCNQLVDHFIIRKLYEASQAGVKISLIVRGICCIRPGLPGISENIRVISIVGRDLEHARAYWFHHAGEPALLIGSADLMPRNLDGRIEVLVPILDPAIRDRIKRSLDLQLRDNTQCWELAGDGRYTRLAPKRGEKAVNSQLYLGKHYGQI